MRTVVESLGLWLVALGCACGTTVIAPQPGYEWCVEVQGPVGSATDPTNLLVGIVEPDLTDPRGCRCFSAAEDQLLDDGAHAEQGGDPLPAGYEALRDELVAAARVRCSELAVEEEPPLMYTNCLSAPVSLPYRHEDASCIVCVEAGVWGGSKHEVECPAGLESATADAPGTSTGDLTTTGRSSLDETGSSDESGPVFGASRTWDAMRWLGEGRAARMIDGMGRIVGTLCLTTLLGIVACQAEDGDPDEDDSNVIDVRAILWCVLTGASGETVSGEEVHVIPTSTNRGACICLPVGTQPYTGSELDEVLHEMALDKCEEDLRALGAVTTDCDELVPDNSVDYESPCDPDDWPPPPT